MLEGSATRFRLQGLGFRLRGFVGLSSAQWGLVGNKGIYYTGIAQGFYSHIPY